MVEERLICCYLIKIESEQDVKIASEQDRDLRKPPNNTGGWGDRECLEHYISRDCCVSPKDVKIASEQDVKIISK